MSDDAPKPPPLDWGKLGRPAFILPALAMLANRTMLGGMEAARGVPPEANQYIPQPPADRARQGRASGGGTGSWGDEASSAAQGPSIMQQIGDYLKSLPARKMMDWRQEGQHLHDDSMKENARRTFGVGHGVDAYDAAVEGRPWAALGNAALGALDLGSVVASPAVAAADAGLHGWQALNAARPAQVSERALQELQKLLPKSGRYNAGSAAHQGRLSKADALADRAIPEPALPAGANSALQARHMLDVIDRRWPGNLMAGVGTAAGATGIPGIMMDDAKDKANEYIDPAIGQYHTMQAEAAKEHEQNAVPLRTDAEAHPNIAHYQHLQGEAQHRRNINAADAGLEMAGGIGASAALPSATRWAGRNMSGAAVGAGAELAAHGPLGMALGAIPIAAGLLPFAVPAALGYGAYQAAYDIPEHASAALDAHAKAKLIGKILQNYQDPQMKLTADGDY